MSSLGDAAEWVANEISSQCMQSLLSVLKERLSQERRWGVSNHDPFCWLAILTEEVGELSEQALANRFGDGKHLSEREMKKECIQVAAVALSFLECLNRGKWAWGDHVKTITTKDGNT